MSLTETTALAAAGLRDQDAATEAVRAREEIFQMTQAAEEAVLRPRDTGRWPHPLRSALAARIARLNGEAALAARYLATAGEFRALADPENDGAAAGFGAVIAFMDKVAAQTRAVEAADISALQSDGIADADIVRLAELNAFLAYQIRVVAGLRLMAARA